MTDSKPSVVDYITKEFPESLRSYKFESGDLYLSVDRKDIVPVVTALKTLPESPFDYFSECTAVDYSRWEHPRDFTERFEVVYNLLCLESSKRIFVKIGVNLGEKVPTLTGVFPGADYPEREVWDLFGIEFEGNEQKQRFILPDDWVGHPLRKEYPLGGEEVLFDKSDRGPSVGEIPRPRAGESFEGRTGTGEVNPLE